MNHYLLTLLLLLSGVPLGLSAQDMQEDEGGYAKVSLTDLSAFDQPGNNWQIIGSLTADLEKAKVFSVVEGQGVLVNLPNDNAKTNLKSLFTHGDLDLELEFMMAKGSNSGIYLQGRYEVQLLDSWGKTYPKYSDCGGIYERWDDARSPKGYQGYAPRSNASLAPGLWQKMEISFDAPRFDTDGKKVKNALIRSVKLNGVLIHENVTLTGPTRGPLSEEEVAKGPLYIQGDHGPVAFRNIKYKSYELGEATLSDLSYKVYEGQYYELPKLDAKKPVKTGKIEKFSQKSLPTPESFIVNVMGTIDLPITDHYTFTHMGIGEGAIKVDGELVAPFGDLGRGTSGTRKLEAGKHKIEILYNRRNGWGGYGQGLFVGGNHIRTVALHSLESLIRSNPSDPIYVKIAGNEVAVHRSFVDHQFGTQKPERIVRAVSVGFPNKLSYTYNPDNGALVRVWKGGFLDASPMWDNRGDGSSRPIKGSLVLDMENASPLTMPNDSMMDAQAEYEFLGYSQYPNNAPLFEYLWKGNKIQDYISLEEDGKVFNRKISWEESAAIAGVMWTLGKGKKIEKIDNGVYVVDRQYYVKLTSSQAGKEVLTSDVDGMVLKVPLEGKKKSKSLAYQVMW